MHQPSGFSRSILLGITVALFVAGCGASGSQFSPTAATMASGSSTNATKMRHDDIKPTYLYMVGSCFVYWVTEGSSGYYLYEPPGCDPAEGAYTGVASENKEQKFLAGVSTASSNFIAVANSKGKQVGTLTGLTGDPVGIATDAKADVWATNYPSNTISEFGPGAKTPTATFTDGNLSSLRYVAVDQDNNVYVSGQRAGSGNLEVDELQGSAFTPIKTITGAVGAGIAISPKTKTLWVCDEGDGTSGTISGYTIPGFKRRMQSVTSGDDTGIAVSKSGKEIYVIDNVADGSQFDVSVVVYNAKTGKVVSTAPSITTSAKAVGISALR